MTKRLAAALLCLAVALAVAAGAAEAATGPTVAQAQKLARKLAEKQVRNRDIVTFHVLKGRRTRAGRVLFAYDDRSAKNVYCTATIVVTQHTVHGRLVASATFQGQRCKGITGDALGFESAVRQVLVTMRGSAAATADALQHYQAGLKPCKRLRVPAPRRIDARLITQSALTEALAKPNDAALAGFVGALAAVKAVDPVLAASATAWGDYLTVLRSLPPVPDPCGSLQAWAEHHWSAANAPVDLASLRALDTRAGTDVAAIKRAAKLLAGDGITPKLALDFTPQGLLLDLAPKVGTTGGAKK